MRSKKILQEGPRVCMQSGYTQQVMRINSLTFTDKCILKAIKTPTDEYTNVPP